MEPRIDVHQEDIMHTTNASSLVLTTAILLGAVASGEAQLVTDRHQWLMQDDVGGLIEPDDYFGDALAAGDFDGDGYLDLAIGAPGEDVASIADAGAVFITFGSDRGAGWSSRPDVIIHQDISGVQNAADPGDRFGAAVVAGDFDGNGYDDLAVGVPGEDDGTVLDVGMVHVFYGSPVGIDPNFDEVWHQDRVGVPDSAETGDRFGTALAVGDFDRDGRIDLAVGVPGETIGTSAEAGAVDVIYGAIGGLVGSGSQHFWDAGASSGDLLGTALAAGDVDGDGIDDLVVGAPGDEGSGSQPDSGRVWVIPGSTPLGLTSFATSLVSAVSTNAGAHLGQAVAVANVDGGAAAEIMAGQPDLDLGADSSGRVWAWKNDPLDLVSLRQGRAGVPESPEPYDRFGEVVTCGDFDGNGYDDVVVGVPGENLYDGSSDPRLDAGVVHVLYGRPDGLRTVGSQLWTIDTHGINWTALDNDHFGGALAAGDYNGDGVDDLAIGAPTSAHGGQPGAGIVLVLYGKDALFSDGFESGNFGAWSSTSP
jgi:hypothetical protein